MAYDKYLGTNAAGTQMDFTENDLKVLNQYQSDGIDYLYDFEPQSNNLFYVAEFVEAGTSDSNYKRPFYNAAYRIRSISIPLPSFAFKADEVTRLANIDQINFPQDVTIEWLEDVYHSVKKYHLDWMSRWYNRGFDVLRCGVQGKFRRCRVVAFHYINKAENTTIIEVPEVQPLFVIDIAGMAPENIGEFKFSHDADGNDQPVSIKYKASRINIIYGAALAGTAWDGSTGTSKQIAAWNPTGFVQEYAGSNVNHENSRISWAATSHISSEGSLA